MIASPNELLYFMELSQTLNFSRAAERIGISQPSLSSAIKKLEHSLGSELFLRDKHKVVLTPAGKHLLLHTKQLLQLWESTKTVCMIAKNEVQGNVILGCHPSIGLSLLSTLLPPLLHTYPKLEVQLKHDLSRKITEEVINFNVDIGIVANPIKHADLVIKKLFNDKVTLWQTTENTFTNLDERVVICDPDLLQTQWLLKMMKKKGIKYQRILKSSNLEIIASLTAAGAGVGILPTCIAKFLCQNKIERLKNSPVYQDEICLIYRHENRNIKAIQILIDAIRTKYLSVGSGLQS